MAKNMKKKGFKRFFLCLLIYVVVFSGLVVWGLTEFWSFIDAYEVSRPSNAIEPFIQQLTKEQIAAGDPALLERIDHNIQSADACKQFILDSLTQDITYAQNVSESTDSQLVYMLLHGGKAIGKVTLKTDAADQYGFTPWKVAGTSYDFSYLIGSKASITVPHDFTVYCNGVALDSSYITQDNIPYPELKDYYRDHKPPYMVTYTVDPILGEILLTTKDRDGNDVTVDENTDLTVYMNNCSNTEQQAIDRLLKAFLHSYVAFTSNQGGKENTSTNYKDLLTYLVPEGDMAKRMYQALDGLGWARNTNSSITDIRQNRTVALGDGRYLCDVTYTVESQLYRDDPVTVNNAKIIMVELSGKLYVESLLVY